MKAPMKFQRRAWTDDELDRLEKLYASSTTEELVRTFRRSASSIFQKASLLKLRRNALPPVAAPGDAPFVLDTTPTLHGTKTTYRHPAGGTVTRHTME